MMLYNLNLPKNWADEERARLAGLCGCINDSAPIKLALIAARAQGMRDAADFYESRQEPTILGLDGEESPFHRAVYLRAARIIESAND